MRDTPNPAMYDHPMSYFSERKCSEQLLKLESNTLLFEIQCLEKRRQMQSDRLQNVIQLVMTEATMRDSASMKQISYLTAVLLLATYLPSVFGVYVAGIDVTFITYIGSTVILTMFVAWVIVALHEHSSFHSGGRNMMRRGRYSTAMT
ncbi:hypothetical protein V8E55_007006 [Tylopilus felleus]